MYLTVCFISGGEIRQRDTAATTKDGEDKDKLPRNDKPTDEKKAKRRPSIRDLFGGDDSEEEVDDELKQLVAQQGSINVHYPIKMPIVLKTNFISEEKGLGASDEVPISKKWIPIYPEAEKNKSSGPKWKAIGWSEKDSSKTSTANSRRMDDSQNGHSKVGKSSTAGEGASAAVRSVKVNNNGLKVEKKDIKGVIVERRFGFSRTVELANITSTATTTASATSAAAIVVKSDLKPSASSEVVVVNAHSSTTEASDKLKSDSQVQSGTTEKKVRVCKHGRVIKKEKPKETTVVVTEQLTVSRKRSQASESLEDKKPPKGNWTAVFL